MFRFVALAWDVTDAAATTEVRRVSATLSAPQSPWRNVFSSSGLAIFVVELGAGINKVYQLPNGAGAVLGVVFQHAGDLDEDTYSRHPTFSADEAERIVAEGPERLVKAYWGWYVAFVNRGDLGGISIFRAPMSDLPCFYINSHKVSIFFSRVEDGIDCSPQRFSVDWDVIQLLIGFGQVGPVGRPAIRELSIVEKGEEILLKRGTLSKRSCWDPCDISRHNVIDDPSLAAKALRTRVRACVHAWASQYGSIMHRLSGGFDSSLVAHCLSSAPSSPEIACINYFWKGSHIDERAFARAAAKGSGLRLIELRFGTDERLDCIRNVERTIAPVQDISEWQEHARQRELAKSLNAGAIFMGALGDALFDRSPYLAPACDYLQRRGLDMGFAKTVMDVALHQRVSVWKVLFVAAREKLLGMPRGVWNAHTTMQQMRAFDEKQVLVSDDIIDVLYKNASTYAHPWLQKVDGVPAGKLWTIMTLFVEGFHDVPFQQPGDPRIVAPYISQPLVELCLRIPTYLNVSDGMERAIARKAFARELPEMILRRRSKGSPNTWLKDMIERDASFIREFLLDGRLVQERIVDKMKLERALPGQITGVASHGGGVMALLYTEAWLQAWLSRKPVAA